MGTPASKANLPLPDTSNVCNVSVGEYTPDYMPHFCTFAGEITDFTGIPEEYCGQMSSGGEWGDPIFSGTFDICWFNSCNRYQDYDGAGCDGKCCGLPGKKMRCSRLKFTGDPLECCLNNHACSSSSDQKCFSDGNKQHTCSDGRNGQPNHRSNVSLDCRSVLSDYCAGTLSTDDYSSSSWLDRWTTTNVERNCASLLIKNIFIPDPSDVNRCSPSPSTTLGICNLPLPPSALDADGFFWAQQTMEKVLRHYTDIGYQLGSLPGQPTHHPFQEYLYNNLCCPYPALCSSGLKTACSGYRASRLSLNPAAAKWCGCYLPDSEYSRYADRYGISVQCSPTCNRSSAIPLTGINGTPLACANGVCIIDDVSVNLYNNRIGDDISFEQICANCGGGSCNCVVSNSTLSVTDSTIGGSIIPVRQGCSSTLCQIDNPDPRGPPTITVPCNSSSANPYQNYQEEKKAATLRSRYNSVFLTIIIVAILILILLFVLFLLSSKGK